MQDIRYLTINESDLAWLFHTSVATVEKWKKSGLQQKSDGKFLLSDAVAWLKNQHKIEIRNKLITGSFSQQEIIKLFGVSRQSIYHWGQAGMPRNKDQSYNLPAVCRWLRTYCHKSAEREYQGKLKTIRRKICRNVKQIEKFLAGEKSINK